MTSDMQVIGALLAILYVIVETVKLAITRFTKSAQDLAIERLCDILVDTNISLRRDVGNKMDLIIEKFDNMSDLAGAHQQQADAFTRLVDHAVTKDG